MKFFRGNYIRDGARKSPFDQLSRAQIGNGRNLLTWFYTGNIVNPFTVHKSAEQSDSSFSKNDTRIYLFQIKMYFAFLKMSIRLQVGTIFSKVHLQTIKSRFRHCKVCRNLLHKAINRMREASRIKVRGARSTCEFPPFRFCVILVYLIINLQLDKIQNSFAKLKLV